LILAKYVRSAAIFSSLLIKQNHTLPSSLCTHENLVLRGPSDPSIKCIGWLKFSFCYNELIETVSKREAELGEKTLVFLKLNQLIVS